MFFDFSVSSPSAEESMCSVAERDAVLVVTPPSSQTDSLWILRQETLFIWLYSHVQPSTQTGNTQIVSQIDAVLFCFKGIFTDILTLFMWRKVRIMEVRTIEPAQCRYLNTAGVMEPTYFTSSSWKFLHSHRTEFILLLVRCDWLNRLKSFWATLRKNKRE